MLKTLLRVRLAAFAAYFTGASRSQKKRSGAQKIAMLLLMLYCFAAFGMLFYTSFSALADVYAKLSLGWLYFAIMSLLAILLGAFGSVFNTYSGLYLAKDNDLLLSMPIPVGTIMVSRLLGVYLMGLMYSGVVLIPAAAVYLIIASHRLAAVIGCILLVLLISVFLGGIAHSALFLPMFFICCFSQLASGTRE